MTIALLVAAVLASLSRSAANSVEMGQGVQRQTFATQTHLMAKDNAIDSLVILVSSSADQQAKLHKEIQERDRRIVAALEALTQTGTVSAEDAKLIDDIRKRHATYRAGVDRIVGMVLGGKQAEAAFAADEEMIPMLAPFLGALAKLEERQLARLRQTEQDNRTLIGSTQWLSLGAGAVAVLLAIAAGSWIVLSLTRPLARALTLARQVAGGDLTARVQASGNDEVSQLLRQLDRMCESLSDLVARVRTAADSIATGSKQIAAGNSDLSQRTEMQASALEQTAASMEQLGTTVTHNADNARQANQLALGASDVAIKGGEVVGQVIQTMKGINESSKRIADAAREIKALIQESAQQTDHGAIQVDQAGDTMKEVVSAISRVSDIMGEINAAATEQTAGIGQVSTAVYDMDQATQQNAALVEETAAASSALSEQANRLADEISFFKLA